MCALLPISLLTVLRICSLLTLVGLHNVEPSIFASLLEGKKQFGNDKRDK